jgi:2'-5' RNA ligase
MVSEAFNEFLKGQERIYETDFRKSNLIKEKGAKKHSRINQRGYVIVIRHPREVEDKVEAISVKIAEHFPSMPYRKGLIHTTLFFYGISDDFSRDDGIIGKASQVVRKLKSDLEKMSIDYPSWIYNQEGVIVAGYPNEAFFKNVQRIKEKLEKDGGNLEFKLPWGAHITASRFIDKVDPSKLDHFYEIVENAPIIGKSSPRTIDVGYAQFSEKSIEMYVQESFSL